jgi:uncharacterized protein Veg
MIKSNVTLSQVKQYIAKLKEKPVMVTLSLGRNRYVSFAGKLRGVYSALFTVEPFDKSFNGKTSYSYSELMCGRVKLKEAPKQQIEQIN